MLTALKKSVATVDDRVNGGKAKVVVTKIRNRATPLTLFLPIAHVEVLRKLASATGHSVGYFVQCAVADYLEKIGKSNA